MRIEEETISIRDGEGFDFKLVEHYLREHIPGIGEGSLFVRQFPAGASNLTYLLQIGDWEGVLRRPPFGPVPPKAHDMERESTMLLKINPVFPLAPRPYVFCDDLAILGVPFYVMERRTGVVLNTHFPADNPPTEELCRKISETVVNTLVQIHAVDWQAAGLSEFGYPEGFLKRQVKSWIERYHRAATDEIPEVEQLTHWLANNIPESPAPTLIHNDFKLNNMLLDKNDLTKTRAVLDWEMATIGDPLFDMAVSLTYWATKNDPEELKTVLPTVTMIPGFVTRQEFMDMYAEKSGRDLSSMLFYMVFAYFRLVVIIQQIYVRWKRGQTKDPRFEAFGERVRYLIHYSNNLIETGKI